MRIADRLRSLLGLDGRTARKGGPKPMPAPAIFLHGKRDFAIEARGASRYQAELAAIATAGPLAGLRHRCSAELVLDGAPGAGLGGEGPASEGVAIEIDGWRVGFLPRSIATQYREWLENWDLSASRALCRAVVVHWPGGGATPARYVLRLDLEIPFKMTTLSR